MAWSSAPATLPTPHSRPTGSGDRNSPSLPGATTTSPSGFSSSDATLATNLFAATPTEAVRLTRDRIFDLI